MRITLASMQHAKRLKRALRHRLSLASIHVTQSVAGDCLGKMLGFADWADMKHRIEAGDVPSLHDVPEATMAARREFQADRLAASLGIERSLSMTVVEALGCDGRKAGKPTAEVGPAGIRNFTDLEALLDHATRSKATDIHLVPGSGYFAVDLVLAGHRVPAGVGTMDAYGRISARIQELAGMPEKAPYSRERDGGFRHRAAIGEFDLRVKVRP